MTQDVRDQEALSAAWRDRCGASASLVIVAWRWRQFVPGKLEGDGCEWRYATVGEPMPAAVAEPLWGGKPR